MSESGLKALPGVWEWSGGPPGCPGVVRRPSRFSGSVRVPSRLSGSGRRPSRMSGSGQEAFPDVRERS